MKKFMKALALALALCMVLSVSAFAADLGKTDDATAANPSTHTVAFDITGVNEGEQVALLILAQGTQLSAADENTILYIDQTAATASGARFEATIKEGVTYVDVYVGSQAINADTTTNANGGAWEVYTNLPVAETSSITIATGTARKIMSPAASGAVENTGTVQYGVAIKMYVNNLGIDKMIWAFGDGAAEEKKVYSKAITLNYDATAIEGETWFTAAVAPSIIGNDAKQLSALVTVNAIFLDSTGESHFTDEADKAKENK